MDEFRNDWRTVPRAFCARCGCELADSEDEREYHRQHSVGKFKNLCVDEWRPDLCWAIVGDCNAATNPGWVYEHARRVEAERLSAKSFVDWLGYQNVLVRVHGIENGHPFDREVSLTDALTDFRNSEANTCSR